MGRFVKGDICVLPFPFSDLSASKWKALTLPVSSTPPCHEIAGCPWPIGEVEREASIQEPRRDHPPAFQHQLGFGAQEEGA